MIHRRSRSRLSSKLSGNLLVITRTRRAAKARSAAWCHRQRLRNSCSHKNRFNVLLANPNDLLRQCLHCPRNDQTPPTWPIIFNKSKLKSQQRARRVISMCLSATTISRRATTKKDPRNKNKIIRRVDQRIKRWTLHRAKSKQCDGLQSNFFCFVGKRWRDVQSAQ